MISKLHQRLETTFIYVTHDQVEAMTMGSRIAVLRDGRLQQLDSPQALYEKPANMFVAGFIGSPAMNFFDAVLRGSSEAITVDVGSFTLELPPDKGQQAADYLEKEVVLGIRPEDLHSKAYARPDVTTAPLVARVDMTELMGNEIYVYLLTGETRFVARVDSRTEVQQGMDLELVVNMDNVHLFDPGTELAIL